jgi:hypothetical protein
MKNTNAAARRFQGKNIPNIFLPFTFGPAH